MYDMFVKSVDGRVHRDGREKDLWARTRQNGQRQPRCQEVDYWKSVTRNRMMPSTTATAMNYELKSPICKWSRKSSRRGDRKEFLFLLERPVCMPYL